MFQLLTIFEHEDLKKFLSRHFLWAIWIRIEYP